jgi:hypothetical protein
MRVFDIYDLATKEVVPKQVAGRSGRSSSTRSPPTLAG